MNDPTEQDVPLVDPADEAPPAPPVPPVPSVLDEAPEVLPEPMRPAVAARKKAPTMDQAAFMASLPSTPNVGVTERAPRRKMEPGEVLALLKDPDEETQRSLARTRAALYPGVAKLPAGTPEDEFLLADPDEGKHEALRALFGMVQDPDAHAKVTAISKATKVPATTVEEALPEFEQAVKLADFDPQRFMQRFPHLVNLFLERPETAKVALHDNKMGQFEKLLNFYRLGTTKGWIDTITGTMMVDDMAEMDRRYFKTFGLEAMEKKGLLPPGSTKAYLDQIATDEAARRALYVTKEKPPSEMEDMPQADFSTSEKLFGKRTGKVVEPTIEELEQGIGGKEERIPGVAQAVFNDTWAQHKLSQLYSEKAHAILGKMAGVGDGPSWELEKKILDLEAAAPLPRWYGDDNLTLVLKDVGNLLPSQLNSWSGFFQGAGAAKGAIRAARIGSKLIPGLRGIPDSAWQAAEAIGWKVGGGTGMFLASSKLETGSAFEDYSRAKTDKGERVAPETAAALAAVYGVGAAIVEVGVETGPIADIYGAFLKKAVVDGTYDAALKELLTTPAGATFRKMALDVAATHFKGAAAEGAEEFVQQEYQDLVGYVARFIQAKGEWQKANPVESLITAWDAGRSAFVGVGVGHAGGSVAHFGISVAARNRSIEQEKIAKAIASGATGPTAKNDPDFFAEWVKESTAAIGEPVTDLYVDPGPGFLAVFQDDKQTAAGVISPGAAQAARELLGEDGPARLREAVATGSRLRISIREYAERFAGREKLTETLLVNASADVNTPTPSQRDAFESLVEDLVAKVKHELANKPVDEENEKPLSRLTDEILATKNEKGEALYTPDQVRNAVQVVREKAHVAAAIEGVTIKEWLDRNEIAVRDVFTRSRVGNETDAVEVATSGDATLNRAIAQGKYADTLTPLGNQAAYADFMSRPRKGAFVFIDLNKFKAVNDTWGHAAGDKVIGDVGGFLSKASRASQGKGFRRSGDEYVFHFNTKAQADLFVLTVRGGMADLPKLPDGSSVGMSMGIAGDVQAADKAMYAAKRKGLPVELTREQQDFVRQGKADQARILERLLEQKAEAEAKGQIGQVEAAQREIDWRLAAQDAVLPREALQFVWDAAGIEDAPPVVRIHQGPNVAKAYFKALQDRAARTMDSLVAEHGDDAFSLPEFKDASRQFQRGVEWAYLSELKARPTYQGKPIWSGVVNLQDGKIEQAFSYMEAQEADFHHALLVNESSREGLQDGTRSYFWIERDGTITSWDNTPWQAGILDALRSQIRLMGLSKLEQAAKHVPSRATAAEILASEAKARKRLTDTQLQARVEQAKREAKKASGEQKAGKLASFKPEGDFSDAIIKLARDLPTDLQPQTEAEWELFAEETSNSVELIGHANSNVVEQGPKHPALMDETAEDSKDRPATFQELAPKERLVVFKQLSLLPDGMTVYDRINKLGGTSWAKNAIASALTRAGVEELLAGRIPDFDSPVMGKGEKLKTLRDAIIGGGERALLKFAEAEGMLSHPEKPGFAVNGSYLDCDPSDGCATYCYALRGPISFPDNNSQSEVRMMAMERFPAQVAEIITNEWRGTDAFRAGGALRFNDKGDLSWASVKVLDYLATNEVRAHVFSRRAALLAEVHPFHLRLYSVDSTNRNTYLDDPLFPFAYVYNGSDEDAAWLNAHKQHVGVILPVRVGQKFLAKEDYKKLDKELWKHICPVDDGTVSINANWEVRDRNGRIVDRVKSEERAQKAAQRIGGTHSRPRVSDWRCGRCDVGGGMGCLHGRTTAQATEALRSPELRRLKEMQRELTALAGTDKRLAQELSEELAALIRAKQQGVLDQGPGEVVREAAPGPQGDGQGPGGAGGDGGQGAGAGARPAAFRILEQGGNPVPAGPTVKWYSRAENAVLTHKQEKGTGDSWLAILSKAPGVKAEELDWIWGLRPFLASKKSFTREEVAAYMKANRLRIEEWLSGVDMSHGFQAAVEENQAILESYGVGVDAGNTSEDVVAYTLKVDDLHGGAPVDVFNFWGKPEWSNYGADFNGDRDDLLNAMVRYAMARNGTEDEWNEVTRKLVDQEARTGEEEDRLQRRQGELWMKALDTWPLGLKIKQALEDFEESLNRYWQNQEIEEHTYEEYSSSGSYGPGAPVTKPGTYHVLGIYALQKNRRIASDFEGHNWDPSRAAGLIGWTRLSEVVLPDGTRAIAVHEKQSDLHQAARDFTADAKKELPKKQWVLGQAKLGLEENLKILREAEERGDAEHVRQMTVAVRQSQDKVRVAERDVKREQTKLDQRGYVDPARLSEVEKVRNELDQLVLSYRAMLEAALDDKTDKGIRQLLDRTEEGKGVDVGFGRKFYHRLAVKVNEVIGKGPLHPWMHVNGNLAEDYYMVTGSRAMQEKLDYLNEDLYSGRSTLVPDAPWKGDAIYDLLVRRVLHYAAERGIHTITWMTGLNVSRMFRISHVVDQLYYHPDTRKFEAWKDDKRVKSETVAPEDLGAWMSKEVADRLLASARATHPKGHALTVAQSKEGWHSLTGEDVNIGGKGMEVYYDQKIPALYEKYLGKGSVKREVVGTKEAKLEWIKGQPTGEAVGALIDGQPTDHLKEVKPAQEIVGWVARGTPEKSAEVLDKGVALFQQDNQGGNGRGWMKMIQEDQKRIFEIVLKPNADASTILHEFGHVFLEVLADMAERDFTLSGEKMPEAIRADFARSLAFMGVKDKAELYQRFHDAGAIREKAYYEKRELTAEERKEINRLVDPLEKWAKAFEAYLMEGKAPSARLEGAFQGFRLYLRDVYQHISAIGVELNPEIRGVFDRLLATESGIKTLEGRMGYQTLFRTPEEAGMTPEQFAAHLKRGEAAMAHATMAAERAGMKAKLASTKAWWRGQVDAAREVLLAQYQATPHARAWAFLKKGDAGGNPALEALLASARSVLAAKRVGDFSPAERAQLQEINKRIEAIRSTRGEFDRAKGVGQNPLGPPSALRDHVVFQIPGEEKVYGQPAPLPLVDEYVAGMGLDPDWKVGKLTLPEWLPLEDYVRDQAIWHWVFRTQRGMTAPRGIQEIAFHYLKRHAQASEIPLHENMRALQEAERLTWVLGSNGFLGKKSGLLTRLAEWVAQNPAQRDPDPVPRTTWTRLFTKAGEKSSEVYAKAAKSDHFKGKYPWLELITEAEAEKALTERSVRDVEAERDRAALAELEKKKAAVQEAAFKRRGEEVKVRPKMDTATVASIVGKAVKTTFRSVTAEGGLDPQLLAEVLQAGDAKTLLDSMAQVTDPEAWATEEAERLVKQANPDVESERSQLEDKLGYALNTDARLTWLLHEMMALRVRMSADVGVRLDEMGAGSAGVVAEAYRRAGLDIAARQKIGRLESNFYLNNSQQSAEKAIRAAAKGDFEQAYVLRQQQLLNLYIYRAILDAKDDRQAGIEFTREVASKDMLGRLGKVAPAYRDGVLAILERFGFIEPRPPGDKPRVPLAALFGQLIPSGRLDENGQAEMIWQPGIMEADGETILFDLPMVQALYENPPAREKNAPIWKSFTVEEFREVIAALRNIKGAAIKRESVLVGKKQVAFDEQKALLLAKLQESLPKRPTAKNKDAMSLLEKSRMTVNGWDQELLRIQTVMRWMDGGDPEGPWTQTFIRTMQLAKHRENDLRVAVVIPLIKAMDNVPKEVRKHFFDKIDGNALFPDHRTDLEAPSRRFELLVLALNAGSESSLRRLLVGRNISYEQLMNALAMLTPAEMAWAQAVWDTMSKATIEGGKTLWELARDLEERDSGLLPEKVEPRAFVVNHVMPDGTVKAIEYAGGYYPAVYEKVVSSIGQLQAWEEMAQGSLAAMMTPEFTRPFTNKQYLKKRSSKFADAISTSPGIVQAHLEKVIHDIAFREVVKSTARLLYDEEIKAGIRDYLGPEREGTFYRWVKDIGSMRGAELINRAMHMNGTMRGMRAKIAVGALGYAIDISTGDLSNLAVASVLSERVRKNLPGAIIDAEDDEVRKEAYGKSGELRFRLQSVKEQFGRVMREFTARRFPGSEILRGYRDNAFIFFDLVDRKTSLPVWLAEYRGALDDLKGQDLAPEELERQAIEAADVMVERLFPSHHAVDAPEIMRDRGFWGSIILFFGYFNLMYQERRSLLHKGYLAVHEGEMNGEEWSKLQKAAALGRVAPGILWKMVAMVVAYNVLGEWLSGRGYEPDKEDPADWWIRKILLGMTVQDLPGGAAFEPTVTGIASLLSSGEWTSKQSSVRAAPIFSAVEGLTRSIARAASGNEDFDQAMFSVARGLGLFTGVPTRPIRAGQYLYNLGTGQTEARWPYAFDVYSGVGYGEHANQGMNPPLTAQEAIEKARK